MHSTSQTHTAADILQVANPTKFKEGDAAVPETPEGRVARLYAASGGPLMGWLIDEARRRDQHLKDMAKELGVTYGYIVQLRNRHRDTAHLSQPVVKACAKYLGVPAIVVKLLAGIIDITDFAFLHEDEEEVVERALRQMLSDPQVRGAVPVDLTELPLPAKKALVMLYAEASHQDVLGVRQLPDMLRWLQRAATQHSESELEAYYGREAVN